MGLSVVPRPASRVLLVDDDDYVREVTGMILEGMGHCVRATGNGCEALKWLEDEPYDLLIADVKMPEIDGPTLHREVLARWPTGGPRVLFVSGFAESPDYENAPEARDVPLLFKPFTIAELKAALDRVLATVRAG
jgi:two-component system, cell cycle sensor histidine kinase and response regulator CckA